MEVPLVFLDQNSRHAQAEGSQALNHEIDGLTEQIDDIPSALLLEAFVGNIPSNSEVLLAAFAKNPNVANGLKANCQHHED